MQQEKIKLPISRPVSSRCRPGLSPSLGGRPPVHTDPRDFQSTLPAHPGACLSLNHPRAGPPSSSPAPCTRNTSACTHTPCPPPRVLRAHGTRPPAHTPCPPRRVLRAHGTRPPAHTPCPLPCCVTCGENPRTVHPHQVQQLERGLPGRLKVVAKSTEGTETIEGIYNTVSVCRASRGGWTRL